MKRKKRFVAMLLSLLMVFSICTSATYAEDDTVDADSAVVDTVDENSAADAVNDDTNDLASEVTDVIDDETTEATVVTNTDEVTTNSEEPVSISSTNNSISVASVDDSNSLTATNDINDSNETLPDDALTNPTYLWENLTNPQEDETGDVMLTVVTITGDTETYQYANIMDAVTKLCSYLNHGDNYQTTTKPFTTTKWYSPDGKDYCWSDVDYTWDYDSAEISFTKEHHEFIDTIVQFKSPDSGWVYAGLPNVTFNGNGTGSIVGDSSDSWDGIWSDYFNMGYSYYMSNMEGTLVIGGDGCTVKNIEFTGNHKWCFGYYCYDQAIRVSNGASNLTVDNNTFQGYSLVTNFGEDSQTVSGITIKNNTIKNCLYGFITSDKGVTDLTFTGNTLIGSEESTLTSCLEWTNLLDFSDNTLIYASFGLRNGESMSQYLGQNDYDHGFIYDDTIEGHGEEGATEWYYAACTTTVMTVLPDNAAYAVWTSDYNEPGYATNYITMPNTLTYTQQDAINDAYKTADDPTYAILTWTSNVNEDGELVTEANAIENGYKLETDSNGKTYIVDSEGNMLHTGIGIGKNYSSMHLDYTYKGTLTINKEITGEDEDVDGIDTSSISFVITDDSDNIVATVSYDDFTNGSYSLKLAPGTYTVTEVTTDIDNYLCTTTVENEGKVEVKENETSTVNFTNTYTTLVDIKVSKVWDDDNSADRPTSVDVTLYAGNDEVKTVTLSEENGWTYTFEDLPKYADGEEIEYTVVEEAIDGYTTSITGSIADGFVITNTLDETPTSTDPTTPTTPSEPDGSTPSETTTPTTSTETTQSTSTTETSTNDATTKTVETNVKTGDSANIALYAVILIIAMFGIVTIRRTYKRKQ